MLLRPVVVVLLRLSVLFGRREKVGRSLHVVFSLRHSLVWRNCMASLDRSGNFFQCPNCQEIDEHIIGDFKNFERDGNLFDADLKDSEGLAQNSERFNQHTTVNCAGEIKHSCVIDFTQQELSDKESPLSKLFSKRIRARKCPNCGLLTKMTRLP